MGGGNGGRNYAPVETTTDEWEAVMERGERNYAPVEWPRPLPNA